MTLAQRMPRLLPGEDCTMSQMLQGYDAFPLCSEDEIKLAITIGLETRRRSNAIRIDVFPDPLKSDQN